MIRTGYSFRTAIGNLEKVIARLQEIGYPAAPMVDRNSTFGFTKWTKACKQAGIRPVYGVELGVSPSISVKGPPVDRWCFLARDTLRPLHELIFQASKQATKISYNNEPLLLYSQALEAARELICITGSTIILDQLSDNAPIYIGLRPSMPKALYNAALRRNFRFVACSDNLYPTKSDRELFRIALGRQRASVHSYPQHILSDDEWRKATEWFVEKDVQEQALINARAILSECKATLPRGRILKPAAEKTLRQLCEEGAKRTNTDLNNPVYRERLEKELRLIEQKDYTDYFYIIADIVNYAKTKMIVGPARGSSCGSLVCYLLNITSIDPIPFDLIFERFIDINRSDPPDIDIDFSDERRDEVFRYAERKYGIDRVARLGTVMLFRPKSALNQAGIALRIPQWAIEKVAGTVIERSSGDARAMQTLEDTLRDTETGRKFLAEYPEAIVVAALEGEPMYSSQHAAGIIITERPIIDYVAVQQFDENSRVAMCDKKDTEELNLLKIDALGLTQLSIFERTLELIGKPSISGYLETLPLDDPAAFDIINKGRFSGIFQFEGMALQLAAKAVTIDKLEDIISITAVARPGPVAAGGTVAWMRRRAGHEEPTTLHPMLDDLTRNTYGVVIYQETVMQIARTIGKLSWEDTSELRRAMSKSLGDEYFDKFWQKFKQGAIENGLFEELAYKIWKQINTMGSWAFNRSHAVAYGLVSYWCCYLKAHYPLEFAAATLDSEKDPARQIAILRELQNEGVNYIPVDPDRSTSRWAVDHDNKRLVGPLTAIKGIGTVAVKTIMNARLRGEKLKEGSALRKKLEEAKTEIDSLYPIEDIISQHIEENWRIYHRPTEIGNVEAGKFDYPITVMGVVDRIAPLNQNEPIRVARRNGKIIKGPADELNIIVRDDSGELLCRIDRNKFNELARPIIERGRPGKVFYAFKGEVLQNFRMLMVSKVKFVCEIDRLEQ